MFPTMNEIGRRFSQWMVSSSKGICSLLRGKGKLEVREYIPRDYPFSSKPFMGRTKPKKKVQSKAKDLHSESKKAPSTTSLLAKAQSLIEQCDYDLALRFINRILDQDPKNAEAKEMLGVALLETGEIEGAKQVRYRK